MAKPIPVCATSSPMRCFRCFKVRAYAYYIATADADSEMCPDPKLRLIPHEPGYCA